MHNNRRSSTVSHNKYTRIQESPELVTYNKHNLVSRYSIVEEGGGG